MTNDPPRPVRARAGSAAQRAPRGRDRSWAPARVVRILSLLGVVAVGAGLAWQAAFAGGRNRPGADWLEMSVAVPDLDCTVWCSVRVMRAIANVDGIAVDSLDPERRRLTLRFDPRRTDRATVLGSLRSGGLHVGE